MEQKKLTCLCILASQQVSIAEIQQELVTEEGWLCNEEGMKKEAAVRAVSEISNKLCSREGNYKT